MSILYRKHTCEEINVNGKLSPFKKLSPVIKEEKTSEKQVKRMAGTLYFIQPAELVGTNRYKIGCSAGNDMIRCKSYKQGTRYMMVLECHQPFVVEKEVKTQFNARFSRIAGKEYFEGNEIEMRDLFYHIYLQHVGRAVMETDEEEVPILKKAKTKANVTRTPRKTKTKMSK
jgi:hypothetical protein